MMTAQQMAKDKTNCLMGKQKLSFKLGNPREKEKLAKRS